MKPLNTPEQIDRYVKTSIDVLIDELVKSGDYDFSDSTLLVIANLTNEYISRLTNRIISENLREPDEFSHYI